MGERVRKTRRWGRVAAAVVVFLLIGAAVNVLVAWSACLDLPGLRPTPSVAEGPDVWEHRYGEQWGRPDLLVYWRRGHTTRDAARWSSTPPIKDKWIYVDHFGVPFRALERAWIIEGSQLRSVHEWRVQTQWFLLEFPRRPLWPGFALNTLIYAALAWGLWRLPFAARRRRRKRRNQCAACGYSRAGLAEGSACPECGLGHRA